MLFAKPKKSVGLDIGTHSVKAVQMSRHAGRLHVDAVGYALLDRDAVNADPIEAHAEAVREALRTMPLAQSLVCGALPGQTVVIRYPRLPNVPDEQLAAAVETEAGQNIPYDLSEVLLDWAILSETDEGGESQLKVLLVAAKHEVIESRVQIADAAGIQYGVLSVDSLAVADAAEACDFLRVGETVALVNLGASSASIHFVKDGVSSFIRDVSWGARELIQAVAKARRCDFDEAERMLSKEANEAEAPQAEPEPTPSAEQSPPDLGGGSLLDPLDGELDMGGGSLLDPLDGDMGGLDTPASPAPTGGFGGADTIMSDILSLPVSRLVTEIRRSLEYYEHQLYENPVSRLILSGGVAQIALLQQSLAEELDVDSVEVADPTHSALAFGPDQAVADLQNQPAQFMVATGLAARGMAEL